MLMVILRQICIAMLMASVAALGGWAQEDGVWAAGVFVALVLGTAACIGREKAK